MEDYLRASHFHLAVFDRLATLPGLSYHILSHLILSIYYVQDQLSHLALIESKKRTGQLPHIIGTIRLAPLMYQRRIEFLVRSILSSTRKCCNPTSCGVPSSASKLPQLPPSERRVNQRGPGKANVIPHICSMCPHQSRDGSNVP
jgi:hypothetical protein